MRFTLIILAAVLCVTSMAEFLFRSPNLVVNTMATRVWRNHHFAWHNVRDFWNFLSPQTQAAITALNWAPPRPSQSYDNPNDPQPIYNNGAGEDFLYMHRQMIAQVNRMVRSQCPNNQLMAYPRVPFPGDKYNPTPPPYLLTGDGAALNGLIVQLKTDEFYYNQMRTWENIFDNPVELRKMPIGEFGSKIEYTIHNWLHVRMSIPPIRQRPQPATMPIPVVDPFFDQPAYDWSGDFYSAHVNRNFWKIHVWVDNHIESWREANGLDEINWVNKWEGGPLMNRDSLTGLGTLSLVASAHEEGVEDTEHDMSTMDSGHVEQVNAIIFASGNFRSFSFNPKLIIPPLP